MKQEKEKKTEKSIQEAEDREREMSVSLTSATVIFTLYQCCADLCCREQTDRQRPYNMAHIPGTFSMGYKPCTHTHTQPSLFMYGASANGTTVIMAAR